MLESTNLYISSDENSIVLASLEENSIVLEHGSRGLTGLTGPTGPPTVDASLLTTGTLNTNRLPATGIFTTAVQAKATSSTYPGAQVASTGKIWSQPSKFAPFTGYHNPTQVAYGSDTQVYIERADNTSNILTVRMNRSFAIDKEDVLITLGSLPASSTSISIADVSTFPNAFGNGFLSYEQINDPLTTIGALSGNWTERMPSNSPTPLFTVGSTGAYSTRSDSPLSGPAIATVSTGENNHEVTCRFSFTGNIEANQGIVLRYKVFTSNGTIGTVSGSGPYTATITGITDTAGLIVGTQIIATNGTGSFGSGTMTIASIPSTTSITVSSTLSFTAGTVTNIIFPHSWITCRRSLTVGNSFNRIEIFGHIRNVVTGNITATSIGVSQVPCFDEMYIKAIASDDNLVFYIGKLNDANEVEYGNLELFDIPSNFLKGTNAGIYNFSASTTQFYSQFSVQASTTFTYTGKTVTSAPAGTLNGVICATAKTFTVTASNPATYVKYYDTSPVALITAVDSVGAVIWRVRGAGGQHTTDNITMGADDLGGTDQGDLGFVFQSDYKRSHSGLVFFGDSAPTDTPNASGERGTYIRRVSARQLRMGGRLHIAPSNLNNFAGTATSNGTPAAPHLGIGNVDTGLYLTTASSVDTLNVAVDGANVASFTSAGFNGALAPTTTATTQTLADNSTKVATTAFVIANAGAGPTGPTGPTGATGATGAISDPGYTSAETYGPPAGTATTGNLTTSRTYYASFYLGKSVTFDRIGVSTGAGFAGTATVRLGIYNMDTTTGKPSTVKFDAGTASVTTTNTSTYITISQTLTAGWYFTAVNMQTAATTSTFRVNGPFQSSPFLSSYNDNANGRSSFQEDSITGAFATAGTLTRQGTTVCPGILRVA